MAAEISIDVEMLAELPAKSMLRLVEVKQKVDKFFKDVAVTMRDVAPLFRFLEDHEIDLRIDPDYRYVGITFTGTGDQFAEVWAELRRNGFAPSLRPKKGDVEYSGYFEREGCAKLHLFFTSTQCKRVQVGTRTVEQPIYETQCGDPLPEIAGEPIAALPAPQSDALTEIPF